MSAYALLSCDAADAVLAAMPETPHALLPDGSMVIELGAEFTARPAAMYRAVAKQIGSIVTVHEDDRGMLVFLGPPAHATEYETVVSVMCDVGVWVPLPRASRAANTLSGHAAADLSSLANISEVSVASEVFSRAVSSLLSDPTDSVPQPEPDDLVLLVRGFVGSVAPVGHPDSGAHEVLMLPDGAALLRTMWHVAARDDVEFVLAEWHTDWVRQHDDPRGVPSFSARVLDAVRDTLSYEDALSRVGDGVEYLTPRALADVARSPSPLLAELLKTR